MKYRILSPLLSICLLFLMAISTYAHSGRTDSSGGHKDNRNASGLGSYHYHCGGYPAHLHTNGACPYTSNTRNGSSPSSSSSNSSASNNSSAQSGASQNSTSSSTTKTVYSKYTITVDKTSIYEKASVKSAKLATTKKDYVFTPIGETKSFWQIEFKKKDDDTIYTGYVLKEDTEIQTKK